MKEAKALLSNLGGGGFVKRKKKKSEN